MLEGYFYLGKITKVFGLKVNYWFILIRMNWKNIKAWNRF